MSFIFDALRKSENERQRGAAPDIARVPLAAPPPQMPRWAIACIAVLGLCVAVLAGAWWQARQTTAAALTNTLAEAPRAPVTHPQPEPDQTASDAAAALADPPAPSPAAPVERASPQRPSVSAPREAPEERPSLAVEVNRTGTTARPDTAAPQTRLMLPSLAQLRASGIEIPTLQLQLHSYSDSAASRFVFINGARYKEGERLEAGPELVRITPDGAVLSQLNREFLLTVE